MPKRIVKRRKECWNYDELVPQMARYNQSKQSNEQPWVALTKIVVPTEEDKRQLLLALEYLHNNLTVDMDLLGVNTLVHIYTNPERIEVSGGH